ncbi:MAG: hypothetical protein RRZ65_06905 [Tannerellaceae bacterium]
MKLNKDLIDAIMMLSFISLVLVVTTPFDNLVTKDVVMAILGVLGSAMVVLRVIAIRQTPAKEEF